MPGWVFVAGFFVVLGLAVVSLVRTKRKAGPAQLDVRRLAMTTPLLRVTGADPGDGWQDRGRKTTVDGLNLRFDHDDDPQAEATLRAPGVGSGASRNHFSNNRTIRLGADFETHHVHTGGYVFRVSIRGTGKVVGKEVRLQMLVTPNGEAYGGRIENDDDTDAAVGDWIEVESAEILRVVG